MRPSRIPLFALALALMPGAAQAGPTPADPWAMPAMKPSEVAGSAAYDLKDRLTAVGPKTPLRDLLADWDRMDAGPAVSAALVTSAMLEGFGFGDAARLYAAYALKRMPENLDALVNYAAISCYPPYLRTAVAATATVASAAKPETRAGDDKRRWAALTNLGSCAMSAKRWDVARESYEKVLGLSPDHVNALLGMGQWYLHIPDVGKAAEYYLRAKRFKVVKPKGGAKAPPPPELEKPRRERFQAAGGEGGAEEGGGGTEHVTETRLRLPDLPNWPGPSAFVAAGPARRPLAEFYGKHSFGNLFGALQKAGLTPGSEANNPLEKLKKLEARLDAMSPEERAAEQFELSRHKPWSDDEVMAGIEGNQAWLKHRLEEAEKAYNQSLGARKPLTKELEALRKQLNDRLKAACKSTPKPKGPVSPAEAAAGVAEAKACLEAFREGAEDACLQGLQLQGRMFAIYRNAYTAWYERVREDLERFYEVQGLWIRQIASRDMWEMAISMRDTAVFMPLGTKMLVEDMERLSVAIQAAASFSQDAETCPRQPPARADGGEPVEPPATSKPKQDCPYDKDPIKILPWDIPFMPLGFEIKCKEATMNVSAGFADAGPFGAAAVISISHRFGSDKGTTVFVGVEGSATLRAGNKEIPAATIGGAVRAGIQLSFDKNGQITDLGGRLSAEDKGSLGIVNSGSVTVSAFIEKGAPDVSMTAGGTGAFGK